MMILNKEGHSTSRDPCRPLDQPGDILKLFWTSVDEQGQMENIRQLVQSNTKNSTENQSSHGYFTRQASFVASSTNQGTQHQIELSSGRSRHITCFVSIDETSIDICRDATRDASSVNQTSSIAEQPSPPATRFAHFPPKSSQLQTRSSAQGNCKCEVPGVFALLITSFSFCCIWLLGSFASGC